MTNLCVCFSVRATQITLSEKWRAACFICLPHQNTTRDMWRKLANKKKLAFDKRVINCPPDFYNQVCKLKCRLRERISCFCCVHYSQAAFKVYAT